jgi:hypothetical protein
MILTICYHFSNLVIGRYLSDVSTVFEQMDELREKQKKLQIESNKPKI